MSTAERDATVSAARTQGRTATPPSPAPPSPAASWLRMLGSELRLILGRRRNQAGMLVLALVPVLIAVAIKLASPRRRTGGPDFFSQITGNGLFVAFAALSVELIFLLPIAIALVSGDAVAGEAKEGTLRYLLTVPVGRTRLLAVKYASLVIVALIAVGIVALAGALIGTAMFGTGDVTTLGGTQVSAAEGVRRLVLSVLYLAAGMAALAAVGLFVSTLTEQPIAVVVTVMILTVVAWLLDGIPQVEVIHPWLLIDAWPAFADLLREPPMTETIRRGLLVDAGYAVVFWLAAWARFSNKDITA